MTVLISPGTRKADFRQSGATPLRKEAFTTLVINSSSEYKLELGRDYTT